MGNVIQGSFGTSPFQGVGAVEASDEQEAAPPAAGAPEPTIPPPQQLLMQLDQVMGHSKTATVRLTNLVPPGAANEERLNALYTTHVTVQDNVADLLGRLQAVGTDRDPGEGAYVELAHDIHAVEIQVQQYAEAVESLIAEQKPNGALPAANGASAMTFYGQQRNWPLIGAFAVGAAAIGFGIWQASKQAAADH
jgi:hypothetical protein